MRFSSNRVPSHVPDSATGQTTFIDTWTLKDDDGNLVATFGRDGSGVVTCVINGTVTDGNGNTLAALPVKAASTDVNTGTDDAKFLTSKAIHDSNYAKTAAITIATAETNSSITPCADNTYANPTSITTKDGIITAIS